MSSPSIPSIRTVYRRSTGPAPNHLIKSTEILPSPLPPTSLLIAVHAISLNYRDINILNGTNPWPTLSNGIPCSDAVGTVLATGSHVQRFKAGDKVAPNLDQAAITGTEQERAWLGGEIEGVLASHIIMDENICVHLPSHLSWSEAACLPNAGLTAWSALAINGTLTAGQTVLCQGTGGVSTMALKLALSAGCKVIMTSSSDEKLEQIRALSPGQISTINYRTTPSWSSTARSLNNNMGVDIIIENGGASSILESAKAVRKGGIISQVGYLGKQDVAQMDGVVSALIEGTVTWRGINCGSRMDFEKMNAVIEKSGLRFEDVVDKVFKWEDGGVEEAFEYLRSGKHVGKIVIEI